MRYSPEYPRGLQFFFDGRESPKFKEKIEKYLERHLDLFAFSDDLTSHLKIESSNSFPHSSGIASSASSMSALVLCLLKMEKSLENDVSPIDLRRASMLSRLASGSAARSVYPVMALWGATNSVSGSSDEYALPIGDIVAPIFKTYHDTILIVSNKEKSVSSRVGHTLMDNHPMAEQRYATARYNTNRLIGALKSGNVETFIDVAENEAIQLHELMATSNPSYRLVEPNTLKIIEEIGKFRYKKKIPVCFTLDAGPNVHLLYPGEFADEVAAFVDENLKYYCFEKKFINDFVKIY